MRILTVLLMVCLSTVSYGNLYWQNTVAISNQNGVALAASDTDSSVGCFAQLIFTGPNGSADSFTTSGSGISGDDAVLATMFAGQNDFLYANGFFPLQVTPAVSGDALNGDYYVRVFNAPNLDFASGTNAVIPATATFYWQSPEHNYTHNETTPDNWDFAPAGGQTLVAIPEPTILALGFLGLLSVRFSRKFMKK